MLRAADSSSPLPQGYTRRIPQGPPGFGVFTVNGSRVWAVHCQRLRQSHTARDTEQLDVPRSGVDQHVPKCRHQWEEEGGSQKGHQKVTSQSDTKAKQVFQLTGLISDLNPSRIHRGKQDPCQLSGFFPLLGQVSLLSTAAPGAFHCCHHHHVMNKGTFWCLVKL